MLTDPEASVWADGPSKVLCRAPQIIFWRRRHFFKIFLCFCWLCYHINSLVHYTLLDLLFSVVTQKISLPLSAMSLVTVVPSVWRNLYLHAGFQMPPTRTYSIFPDFTSWRKHDFQSSIKSMLAKYYVYFPIVEGSITKFRMFHIKNWLYNSTEGSSFASFRISQSV